LKKKKWGKWLSSDDSKYEEEKKVGGNLRKLWPTASDSFSVFLVRRGGKDFDKK